jgi:Tol biopolymer transport system component
MEDIFQFVLFDPETGKEKKLVNLGQPNAMLYSVGGDKIVWTESQYDPRWGYRGYSTIKIFDIAGGTKKSLTRKSRFFAPAVSPDMKRLAAVEFDTRNQCSLVILDVETGREMNRFLNPENEFLMTPRWLPDSRQLLAVKSHPGRGKAVSRFNADDGREE